MNWYSLIAEYYRRGIYDREALEVFRAAGYLTHSELVSLLGGESEGYGGA